jgi:CubicO group peptidase (beta-lactamase class C family)
MQPWPALRFSVAAAALLATAALGCASNRSMPGHSDTAEMRDSATAAQLAVQLDSLRRANGIPGLAIVVLRDTTILLARGFGLSDVAHGTPATPETPFNIASVSKPISAVVALRLVEQNALDLDRSMRRYREFPEFCEAVRVEGGIFFDDYACEGDHLTMRHVLSMTANGSPGTHFYYIHPRRRVMGRLAG